MTESERLEREHLIGSLSRAEVAMGWVTQEWVKNHTLSVDVINYLHGSWLKAAYCLEDIKK